MDLLYIMKQKKKKIVNIEVLFLLICLCKVCFEILYGKLVVDFAVSLFSFFLLFFFQI